MQNEGSRARQERFQENGADAAHLGKVIKNGAEPLLLGGVLGKDPRRRLVDIFIGAPHEGKDRFERVGRVEPVHCVLYFCEQPV